MNKNIIRTCLKLVIAFAITYFLLYILDSTCFIKFIFKIDCPGCGLTRAWISFFNLDIQQAFAFNKMFWSIPLLFLCVFIKTKGKAKYFCYTVITIIAAGFLICWIFTLLQI